LNITCPNRRFTMTKEKVEGVLDKIRPSLVADGGNVELVDVSNGTVRLKLVGACAGCPMSTMTLRMGIERILKREIPEIKEVVAVGLETEQPETC
jgi:Fe-S cluster biogenesis protein NfuA